MPSRIGSRKSPDIPVLEIVSDKEPAQGRDTLSKETTSDARPWDVLHQEIEEGDLVGVEAALENLTPSETARTLSRLSAKDQSQLLTMLPATDAADLVEDMPDTQATGMIERLTPEAAAPIVEALPSDGQADLLGDLSKGAAEGILDEHLS